MRRFIECERRLTFCAGHRLVDHEGKCANLHGHNYVVRITAEHRNATTDGIGRVIDFSVLKERIGGWIDVNWDHKFILNAEDPLRVIFDDHKQPYYPLPLNPTAENIAAFLLDSAPTLLEGTDAVVTSVTVEETENCSAAAWTAL